MVQLCLQPDALKLKIELIACDGVERTERLVHQQDVRIVGQRARDRGTLPHAAGKLARPRLFKAPDADELAELLRLGKPLLLVDATQFQRQSNILLDREPREQIRVLKHDAKLLGDRGIPPVSQPQIVRTDVDRTRAWTNETGDHAQHRGLAAAGRTEQH